MTKRLVLIDEEQAKFIEETFDLWGRLHEGDHSDQAYRLRADRFHIRRHLEGKYTEAEIQEIAALALELLD